MATTHELAIAQIDEILDLIRAEVDIEKKAGGSGVSEGVSGILCVRIDALLQRLVPKTSAYATEAAAVRKQVPRSIYRLPRYVGILRALRDDLEAGWMSHIEELLHADTFDDFLEMATELLEKGYKDAAAVVAGSVLESHLRLLAEKSGIAVMAGKHRKKVDTLNADLVKAETYSKLKQKEITSHLGIRNSAAHGEYDEYEPSEVARMIDAIRDFIGGYPA